MQGISITFKIFFHDSINNWRAQKGSYEVSPVNITQNVNESLIFGLFIQFGWSDTLCKSSEISEFFTYSYNFKTYSDVKKAISNFQRRT